MDPSSEQDLAEKATIQALQTTQKTITKQKSWVVDGPRKKFAKLTLRREKEALQNP